MCVQAKAHHSDPSGTFSSLPKEKERLVARRSGFVKATNGSFPAPKFPQTYDVGKTDVIANQWRADGRDHYVVCPYCGRVSRVEVEGLRHGLLRGKLELITERGDLGYGTPTPYCNVLSFCSGCLFWSSGRPL